MSSGKPVIRAARDGFVGRITLDRPEARNALGTDDWIALAQAVETLSGPETRVIVIESSVDGTFCAGSDIKAMDALQQSPQLVAAFRLAMRAGLEAIAAAPMPTLANIQGDCFGAGVAIALACDLRIAGARARFGVTPARLGIVYPIEDIARLVATVGAGQANRLLMTAGTIDAAEAMRIGLIEMIGDAAGTEATITAIANNAPESLATMKHLVSTICRGTPDPNADAVFDGAFSGAALEEGLRAFREKRRPAFAARSPE